MSEIINKRRSVRQYKPDVAVLKEQLERMLEAAMLAPSACNTRPWEFIVVTRRGMLDELARQHPYGRMFSTASAAIIVVAIPQTGMPEGFFPQDCAAATQNILLEAVAQGLGTCWCGVYPKPQLIAVIRTLLDIPEPKIPFNVIAVGVQADMPAQRGFFEAEKVSFIE